MIFRYTLQMNLSFGAHLFFSDNFRGHWLTCEKTLERCNVFDCVSLKLELHKPWVESNASFLQFQSKRVAVIINPISCIFMHFHVSSFVLQTLNWTWNRGMLQTRQEKPEQWGSQLMICALRTARYKSNDTLIVANYTGRQRLGTSFGKCSSNI